MRVDTSALEMRAGYPAAYIANSECRIMRAQKTGREYCIFLSRPNQPPAAAGYPVVYHLDGNAMFGTVTEAVRVQSARPDATGVLPAIVVGIGYRTTDPFDVPARTFDYTPYVDRKTLSPRADGSRWSETGGADDFLEFIEQELIPALASDYRIDRTRQMLLGHSFGGLFALYAMFTRPKLFRTYVAGSPSIWFGDHIILAAEQEFTASIRDQNCDLRVMLAAGALEQSCIGAIPPAGRNDVHKAQAGKTRMVDNARNMAHRLKQLAPWGVCVAYEEFPGENHISVIPALVSRALRFAFAENV